MKTGKMHLRKDLLFRLTGALAALLAAAALTGCAGGNTDAGANPPAPTVTPRASAVAEGEDLVIAAGDITEKASFYPVEIDGIWLEVLAVRAPDGTVRTAFNTCEVCYDSGRGYYRQEGDVLVCQNCGNRFATSQIEVESSGCNPWPIFPENKTVEGGTITISYGFLQKSSSIFRNWKGNS